MNTLLSEEKKLWKRGFKKVVGLDEAGRGPLAGPVVAAAVYVSPRPHFSPEILKIRDSKKISPKKREYFYGIITRHSKIMWAVGEVSERVIDKINIKNASELAMWKAVKRIKQRPDYLIIDGKFLKNQNLKKIRHKLIIGADNKVFSCIAASIIAKVTRDRLMQNLHKKFPKYGFKKHNGYATKQHLRALRKYGPCKIHRCTFGPVEKRYRSKT